MREGNMKSSSTSHSTQSPTAPANSVHQVPWCQPKAGLVWFFCGDTKLAHRWIKVSVFLPAWVIQMHTRLNEIWIFDGYLIFWICVRGELSCSKSSGPRGSSWENGGGDIGAITSHHRATRCSFPSHGWKKHVRNWIRCHSSKQKREEPTGPETVKNCCSPSVTGLATEGTACDSHPKKIGGLG